MSMIHTAAGLEYSTDSRRRVFGFLTRRLAVFQEWRSRAGQLAELFDLDDRALMDIGIARGEIEYHIRDLDRPANGDARPRGSS